MDSARLGQEVSEANEGPKIKETFIFWLMEVYFESEPLLKFCVLGSLFISP